MRRFPGNILNHIIALCRSHLLYRFTAAVHKQAASRIDQRLVRVISDTLISQCTVGYAQLQERNGFLSKSEERFLAQYPGT